MKSAKPYVFGIVFLVLYFSLSSTISAASAGAISVQGSCDINALIQQIQSVNASIRNDAHTGLQMLQLVAGEIADCARASNRLPGLATYADQQGLDAWTHESDKDQTAQMNSARDIAAALQAAASTTETLTQSNGSAGINHPVTDTFWTSGKVVMHLLVTNPLDSYDTSVRILVPLPDGITPEDVISKPNALQVEYDPQMMSYVFSGEIPTPKGASTDLNFVFKDVWSTPESELYAIEGNTVALYGSLQHTSFASQALTLRDTILSNVGTIRTEQNDAISPYDKLVAQKDAQSLLASAAESQSELVQMFEQYRLHALNRIFAGLGIIALLIAFIYVVWYCYGHVSRRSRTIPQR